jgi:hypothetical protein
MSQGLWYYLAEANSRQRLPAAAWFSIKILGKLAFSITCRIGAAANMSRLDIEMANDLLAFAWNLRSRGFVTCASSPAPNRRGHAREAFR